VHRFASHTGEAQIEIEAPSAEAVFAEAAAAFAELEGGAGGEPARRAVDLAGGDPATLLADWLAELVFLADADGFVPEEVLELELGSEGLRATLAGRLSEPRRLVKAATYHDLLFERREGGWFARVVVDV
jgi:SHS2 domain-containing protein